ncbi:MAG: WXG100 family type VII secretion target [Clostridia bacterium]
MAYIRVTPEELKSASEKLQLLSETYTEIYTQLLGEAESMGTAWQGTDNLAFVDQITGFTEELKTMAEKISYAGQALAQQSNNYTQTQESNITQVKKLAN